MKEKLRYILAWVGIATWLTAIWTGILCIISSRVYSITPIEQMLAHIGYSSGTIAAFLFCLALAAAGTVLINALVNTEDWRENNQEDSHGIET